MICPKLSSNERKLSTFKRSPLVVPPLLPTPVSSVGFVSGTMALRSGCTSVYVAFYFVFTTSVNFTLVTPVSVSANALSLLQPYDFLYYSGVRAYFGGEWGKAAELLEKSVTTKESLFRVRRQCYDDCVAAGKEALYKLGKSWLMQYCVFWDWVGVRGVPYLLWSSSCLHEQWMNTMIHRHATCSLNVILSLPLHILLVDMENHVYLRPLISWAWVCTSCVSTALQPESDFFLLKLCPLKNN